MESGDIPDSAITASSYYSWKHLHFKPKEARLWIGSLGWVSKLNSAGKSNEYLQIDLGKVSSVYQLLIDWFLDLLIDQFLLACLLASLLACLID